MTRGLGAAALAALAAACAGRGAIDRPRADIRSVAFSPDETLAGSGSADGSVVLHAARADGALAPLRRRAAPGGRGVWALAFTPDGRLLLTGGESSIGLWSVPGLAPRGELPGHAGGTNALAVSADGRLALSGGRDGLVRLWDLSARRELARLAGHSANVSAVRFDPRGRWAASASEDGTARVWDLARATAAFVLREHENHVHALAVSSDGRRILTGSCDTKIRLWDAESGRLLSSRAVHGEAVQAISFLPGDAQAVSAGCDKTLQTWSLEGGSARLDERFEADVHAMDVSRDGSRVLLGLKDGTVKLRARPAKR